MHRPQASVASHRRARTLRRTASLLALLACCSLSPAIAQTAATGTIYGKVTNAATGDFVARARITVEGTNLEVFTNDYGEYTLELPAGQSKVRVSFTGIDDKLVDVDINANETMLQDVTISARPTAKAGSAGKAGADDVIVMDAFAVREARETNAYNIAANEQRYSVNLKNVVSADSFGDVTEGNVGEFIKYLPGVTVDYVAADVRTMAVRGFPDTFTSISFDGNRIASASSGNAQRSFEFEQVSLNNITRVELLKVPTPEVPADALGGAVNLISKSAFERAKTQFSFRTYLSMNHEDMNLLKKTPGPTNNNTYKALPGFDFDLSVPVSKKFGIVLTGLSSNQFNEQHRSQPVWNFAQAGAATSNPYLQQYTFQDGPKNSFRQAAFLKLEYKPTPEQLITLSGQVNHYSSNFGNRNLNWDVGTSATSSTAGGTPLSWGSDFTNGATGRGSVRHNTSFRDKYGQLMMLNLGYHFTGRIWGVDAGASYSNSHSWYRDTDNGHFTETRTTLLNVSRVTYAGIREPRPDTLSALSSTGVVQDYTQLSNYRLDTVRTQPVDGQDKFTNGFINVKRDFSGKIPFWLKLGAAMRQQNRDIFKQDKNLTFAGISGSTNAAWTADTLYVNQSPYWGFPNAIQWPSPFVAYAAYAATPSLFTQTTAQALASAKFRIRNSQAIREKVPSFFVEGEAKFLGNRLRVLGGVRYEKTQDDGTGGLTRGAGATIADVQAKWKERGLNVSSSYDEWCPSLSATFNITDDLLLRAAYARTFGRPDFSNILPNVRINDTSVVATDDVGDIPAYTVIATNTGLKPWTADCYDLSLEYYMPRKLGGMISVGAFEKDLKDFWVNSTRPVSSEDVSNFGLPDTYVGTFTLQTTENGGNAKVTGGELNIVQPLKFLPWYFSNLSLTANYTKLHLSGPNNADFSRFIEQAGNLGLTYKQSPVMLMVKLNYRGQQRVSSQTGAQYEPNTKAPVNGFYEYYAPRMNLDVNAEYKLTNHLSLFCNARNILNKAQDLRHINAVTPSYAQLYRREIFGVQLAAGIKGSW
jgi:TonB-dependent receptor